MESEFEIMLDGSKLPVQAVVIGGRQVYYISLNGRRLALTAGMAADSSLFWTFLPASQPELAKRIGLVIEKALYK